MFIFSHAGRYFFRSQEQFPLFNSLISYSSTTARAYTQREEAFLIFSASYRDSLLCARVQAPRPRVLLVLPLGCLERTTIGFRFQKLELHMNASSCLAATREAGDRRALAQGSAMAAAAEAVSSGGGFFWGGVFSTSQASFIGGNGYGGGGQATDERVSIVVLTRDR